MEQQYQQQYQQPYQPQYNTAPVGQLKTNRALWKMIVFTPLTLGIYPIVFWSSISSDINIIAGRYDGKKTMHFCLLAFIFSWLTLGIAPIVWMHKLCNRIGNEAKRRGINYEFDSSTFWLWSVVGSLIVVGPFVFIHKLCNAFNLITENYNRVG